MNLQEATSADWEAMQVVRMAVKENVLSNLNLVTKAHYLNYLTTCGKGWVFETKNQVVGFAIVDALEHSVWALFVLPEFENKGIGKLLHNEMLKWYFQNHDLPLWLSTGSATRAEGFYRKMGWQPVGNYTEKEMKFTLSKIDWMETEAFLYEIQKPF